MSTIEKDLEQMAKALFPFYKFIDINVEKASNGIYRCIVPLNKNNSNHFNTILAAIQWAAAEILGGLIWFAARLSDKHMPVVKNFYIDFKLPATTDIVAEAHFPEEKIEEMKSALESNNRYDFELEAVIKNSNGDIIAETKATYSIRPMM